MIDGKLLADAVLVPAHVGGDDGIAGQHFPHLGQNAFGHHGKGIALFHFDIALLECFPVISDLLFQASLAVDALRYDLAGHLSEHPEGLFQIGDHTDLHRVVASDLAGFDVDLDEFGLGDIEGELRIPGTAVRLLEACAETQDEISFAAGIVDVLVPQKPVMPRVRG